MIVFFHSKYPIERSSGLHRVLTDRKTTPPCFLSLLDLLGVAVFFPSVARGRRPSWLDLLGVMCGPRHGHRGARCARAENCHPVFWNVNHPVYLIVIWQRRWHRLYLHFCRYTAQALCGRALVLAVFGPDEHNCHKPHGCTR